MNIPTYLSPVSIIPGGCLQFLDFELPVAEIARLRYFFREEKRAESGDQRYNHYLRCLEQQGDDFLDMLTGQPATYDYTMDARKELEVWEEQWLPLPFLRIRDQKWPDGRDRFECGPSNWARGRTLRLKDKPDMLRVILVFDTNIETPPAEGEQYHALSAKDVAAHGIFKLAGHVRDNAWFLNAAWIDEWIATTYSAFRQSHHHGRDSWRDESPYVLEHLASYMTWLHIVETALKNVSVQVINPDRDTPVDVDLVLDIGNSRSTGILVETLPQRITNLNDSYLLELRDMRRPEYSYAEPFETRVEFAEVDFGNEALSRRSGRLTPAFTWPSAVRIGPEAARIATHAVCAEGTTGMSSPKRYLWDERPWQQSWRFNTGGMTEPMVTRGTFARQVNQEGTPLRCFDDPLFKKSPALRGQECEPAFESLFTRSSLMMFMMGEILTQALVTINSPATRARRELPNLPRRLRRIILTVPTAMPVAEKRIFTRWVTWAVRLVWEALGWQDFYTAPQDRARPAGGKEYRTSPEIRCDWDEASCSQLVLLYNELAVKHHGDAFHLFNLIGRRRPEYGNRPCTRVASIDIGGGTTDLSITTYELSSGEQDTARLTPHMEFRDGFNIAGDEVLRSIIADHIKPALQQALTARGMGEPRRLLSRLFGRDSIGISQEARNLRSRFIRQIAVPVALGLLRVCESTSGVTAENAGFTCRIGDFFEQPLPSDPDRTDGQPALSSRNAASREEEQTDSSSRPAADREHPAAPQPQYTPAPRPQNSILRGIQEIVRQAEPDLAGFNIMDVELHVVPAQINATIRQTLGGSLAALCELVHLYDADLLLLTGRPSSWQGVINAILAKLPLPPDRIIPMRQYHVGAWYPFADSLGCIADPKTTVVVGAILCALSEGHIEGFTFDSSAFRLTSTARYIGEMDISSQLRNPKIWFTVDVNAPGEVESEHQVSFGGPLPIGYRQLAVERWPTTRYYLLTFRTEEARARAAGRLPYAVTVRLRVTELWDNATDRDEGEFSISTLTDRAGNTVDSRDLEIRLQTLPLDEGYWLDTGNVSDN